VSKRPLDDSVTHATILHQALGAPRTVSSVVFIYSPSKLTWWRHLGRRRFMLGQWRIVYFG
jgi:hypothetical protein